MWSPNGAKGFTIAYYASNALITLDLFRAWILTCSFRGLAPPATNLRPIRG